MRAFWDQDRDGRNFGDALTAVLFERLAGISLTWSEPDEADLFGIGSAAEAIPPGYGGLVFGTGKMFGASQLDLRAARVWALRGPLTGEGSRAHCELYGDPGLLAGELLGEEPAKDVDLGVIPHYVDDRAFDGLRIDVLAGVDQVIAQAARCREIVSSSLHGLVLADALGIPNRWEPCPGVAGEGFKFRDYAAAFGETIRPGEWRLASQWHVRLKAAQLRAVIEAIGREFAP